MQLREEPGKQKTRSCRAQELGRSRAQGNEWQKEKGVPDIVEWLKSGSASLCYAFVKSSGLGASCRSSYVCGAQHAEGSRETSLRIWDCRFKCFSVSR
jgi:hypothetical protein